MSKTRVKPWWQTTKANEFKARIERFEEQELESLSFAILAATTSIARQLAAISRRHNTEWWDKAQAAQLRLIERRALVLSALAKKKNVLRSSVEAAVAHLRAGDCGRGLEILEDAIVASTIASAVGSSS